MDSKDSAKDQTLIEDLNKAIRVVENFPKENVTFRDIAPVFLDADLTSRLADNMISQMKSTDFDAIIGLETRGYLLGLVIAQKLKKPFIMVRKAGKLPPKTTKVKYALEYGFAEIEIPEGAIKKGWKVMIHDDLLATGGTALAAAELVKSCEATIAGYLFIIILDKAGGIENIQKKADAPIFTVLNY
jgi:adenine phosphoribosyltransferase